MRTLLTLAVFAVSAVLAGTPAFAKEKFNNACGASRTDMCKLRTYDPRPDTKTPIPFQLGSGRKNG